MTDAAAVVYDLDGTLVRLDVDWEAARRDAAAALAERGFDVEGADLWELFERAEGTAHAAVVEDVLAEHERAGARTADRLDLADALPHEVPVGVCSLNCEAACHAALEVHGLSGAVDAVVGRDSVATRKPHPEPLLAAIDDLAAAPAEALFVGDSARDEETAERAGVDFAYAADWRRARRRA